MTLHWPRIGLTVLACFVAGAMIGVLRNFFGLNIPSFVGGAICAAVGVLILVGRNRKDGS